MLDRHFVPDVLPITWKGIAPGPGRRHTGDRSADFAVNARDGDGGAPAQTAAARTTKVTKITNKPKWVSL